MSPWPSWVSDLEVQKEMGTGSCNRNHKLKAWKLPFCIKNTTVSMTLCISRTGSPAQTWEATAGPAQGGEEDVSPGHKSCSDSGQEQCSNVQLTSGLHLSLLTEAQFGNLDSQKLLHLCNLYHTHRSTNLLFYVLMRCAFLQGFEQIIMLA